MPISVTPVAGGSVYASPMVGPVNHVLNKKIDLSGLTVDEVDVNGYLKPGVVLKEVGNLLVLVGAAAAPIFVVVEPTKLNVTTPATNATLAAETGDHMIGVATHGLVNRDIAEDNMGRAYTANELTSFVTAGTHLALTTT
jgi:hypothetical protein